MRILASIAVVVVSLSALGQNWKARMYSTYPAGDPYIIAGGPTNWAAEWVEIGTNLTASAPYIFVGNNAARDSFIAARLPTWQSWKTNVFDVQVTLAESNRLLQISQNLALLNNLYQTNIAFMGLVATNRPAVTVTVLSNQTVTVTRILNQIAPLLKDLYNERQNKIGD